MSEIINTVEAMGLSLQGLRELLLEVVWLPDGTEIRLDPRVQGQHPFRLLSIRVTGEKVAQSGRIQFRLAGREISVPVRRNMSWDQALQRVAHQIGSHQGECNFNIPRGPGPFGKRTAHFPVR